MDTLGEIRQAQAAPEDAESPETPFTLISFPYCQEGPVPKPQSKRWTGVRLRPGSPQEFPFLDPLEHSKAQPEIHQQLMRKPQGAPNGFLNQL
jgi:hypothetical protein